MKQATLLMVTVSLMLMSACTKEGTALFKGNYSFKTSGYVTVARDTTYKSDPSVTVKPDTAVVAIANKSGQMDITVMDDDSLLITMNCTAGDLIVYYGTVDDDRIVLDDQGGNSGLISIALPGVKYSEDIRVSGEAAKYDNIVLFKLDYTGSYILGDYKFDIIASDVNCRAKEND